MVPGIRPWDSTGDGCPKDVRLYLPTLTWLPPDRGPQSLFPQMFALHTRSPTSSLLSCCSRHPHPSIVFISDQPRLVSSSAVAGYETLGIATSLVLFRTKNAFPQLHPATATVDVNVSCAIVVPMAGVVVSGVEKERRLSHGKGAACQLGWAGSDVGVLGYTARSTSHNCAAYTDRMAGGRKLDKFQLAGVRRSMEDRRERKQTSLEC